MLLAVDVGNTNVKLGLFRGRDLVAVWRLATDLQRTADEWGALFASLLAHRGLGARDVDAAVVSSVVPLLTPAVEGACRAYLEAEPLTVGAETKTGLRLGVDNPSEVGTDRIVNAAAAHDLYGGPLIVVGLGTATTFDAVSGEGEFLGGAIAPGLETAAEALTARTAKLPRIELAFPQRVVGTNTVQAMQAGVLYGYLGLVEGVLTRMRKEMGVAPVRVIATGGLAPLIAPHTSVIDQVDPDLTLQGLRIIYGLNRPAG